MHLNNEKTKPEDKSTAELVTRLDLMDQANHALEEKVSSLEETIEKLTRKIERRAPKYDYEQMKQKIFAAVRSSDVVALTTLFEIYKTILNDVKTDSSLLPCYEFRL